MICKQHTDAFQDRFNINEPLGNRTSVVGTKEEMVERLAKGEFGNIPRMWFTYESLIDDQYQGPVGIRCTTPDSTLCRYNIDQKNLLNILDELICQNTGDKFYFSESAPDDNMILQGEFGLYKGQFVLFMSTEKTQMRVALKNSGIHLQGAKVLTLIKAKMWSASFDAFMKLYYTYPTAIIEFSIYSVETGIIPNHNVLIWEVRNY